MREEIPSRQRPPPCGRYPVIALKKTQLRDPDAIERLVTLRHHDPFELLGNHPLEQGGRRVDVLRPGAARVTIHPLEGALPPRPARRVHAEGLHEAVYPEADSFFPYRVEVRTPSGESRRVLDPYQFPPVLEEAQLDRIRQGTEYEIYRTLGCHRCTCRGEEGLSFAVWAPNAQQVSVIGDFNDWDPRLHMMRVRGSSGVWEIFLPNCPRERYYKFELRTPDGERVKRADPFAFCTELRPGTASVTYGIPDYEWQDEEWMLERDLRSGTNQPINAYEVHLPSWRRSPEGEMLGYRQLAEELVEYLERMNFTHVELMPVMEHPLDDSWGYQVTGFFAPTRRHGSPEDFMYFVDYLHRNGYGVLLDWVPGHFPRDEHGLARFDGTALYEYADPREGYHPDWDTHIFNFARHEVRNFLLGNALFWLDCYHLDGIRVDAVASMLYRDYSRPEHAWVPNRHGGRENLEAIRLLQDFNELTHAYFPGVLTIAEESTAWDGVTREVRSGGLGFDLKWNMGWMHDTLEYFSRDPIHRKYHHDVLPFMLYYAFEERFMLALSHDEVVHGKRSLLEKMPGDDWKKFAHLRLLFGFQLAHPGKTLLFMGGEFGQRSEWRFEQSLDWHLLERESHAELQRYVARLNAFYQDHDYLWRTDFDSRGFEWIDYRDREQSVIALARLDPSSYDHLVFVFNFTPVLRDPYRIGVPSLNDYREVLTSDAVRFGGGGTNNGGALRAERRAFHGREQSVELTLPPLGMCVLRPVTGEGE